MAASMMIKPNLGCKNASQHSFRAHDWTSEHTTGTSIFAVEFDGGVVIGADSRTTTGSYIPNRVTDKLTCITDNIYCCRSGSSADTQAVADICKYNMNFYKMQMNDEPTVATAARIFQNMCYGYRDQISAGIIVAGWDKQKGGQVYSVPLGGALIRQPVAVGGSGSTYIWGYVDAHFKENMTKKECEDFVTNSLALAMIRDGSSGGVIRTATITEKGVERRLILNDDLPKFYQG
ncbi:proteasome subunit beta type-6-like [Tubulanus polymorphus]|uniref:proteasome subunit beta type-6-like n=1 Tax=Tubulanus polymorphus TaxID=672921 RepID=UPI003DA4911B